MGLAEGPAQRSAALDRVFHVRMKLDLQPLKTAHPGRLHQRLQKLEFPALDVELEQGGVLETLRFKKRACSLELDFHALAAALARGLAVQNQHRAGRFSG